MGQWNARANTLPIEHGGGENKWIEPHWHGQASPSNVWKFHYEKLHSPKPHYPKTKTQKKNLYIIVIQLSLGYYNYYAIIPL